MEVVSLKDLPIEDAQIKIKEFLEYFKIISIRKGTKAETEIKEKRYATHKDRWALLPEFMKLYPETFAAIDYYNFLSSKGIILKDRGVATDDMRSFRRRNIVERIDHKWKFITGSEEAVRRLAEEVVQVRAAKIPGHKQRVYMMSQSMAEKEYFTISDWIDFMSTPPNNYEAIKIKNSFYHDIGELLETSRAKEIKTEDGNSYHPKRYKIIKIEPQAVDERMIKDLKDGQKVLLGTIR